MAHSSLFPSALQQRLTSPCEEEEAASLPPGGHMQGEGGRPGERGRLGEDWRALEEQRTHFEKERRTFTEAAIRLSHEVGAKSTKNK